MNTTKITKSDGEYRVRLFVDGEYQPGADYYTDDKEDALETAAAMERNGGKSDKNTTEAIEEAIEYAFERGCLYDVCNDYSLELRDTLPNEDWNEYALKNGRIVHREYNELHYFIGSQGLDGETI